MSKELNNLYGLIFVIFTPYLLFSVGEGEIINGEWYSLNEKNIFGKDNTRTNPGWVVFWHSLIISIVFFILVQYLKNEVLDKGWSYTDILMLFNNFGVWLCFLFYIFASIQALRNVNIFNISNIF